MSKYVCIHGHFYQPPRENPWLEAIEVQDSAYPHHDWNERITDECYRPNARSRILDGERYIVKIVNNYARISFNFGPTVLSWMEAKQPEVYAAILEADQRSAERFSGHGSALAQAYNHMIMPLANDRDRRTQVIWGIRDFERRFGRRPEGMWLPETAANTATLETLAEHGIAFTVLAPHQAARARARRGGRWRELGGDVDPRRAYLARLPSGREIALFFYDGPISRAVAFEGLLNSGPTFANRVLGGLDGREQPQLAHLATDGETYGHHHRHGDMALAWALDHIDEIPDVALTNYGEFLEHHPPTHLAEIVEDTSWSCVHGIERWRSDCGCSGGGDPSWHQRWRAPLREALDWLRDELVPRYEQAGAELLADPWRARDEYIDVIHDRSPESVDGFLAGHATHELDDAGKIRALKLLELQRHALLMYTSCGWFFSELSGIETVQVIQYAGRSLQLAGDVFGESLEPEFIDRLARAPSNIEALGDGRGVYEKHVRPGFVDLHKVGAHYALSALFEDYGECTTVYAYEIRSEETRQRSAGRSKLLFGRARVASTITRDAETTGFIVLHLGDHVINGAIGLYEGHEAFEELARRADELFDRADFVSLLRLIDESFGTSSYSLESLFRDEQRHVVDLVLKSLLVDVEATYRHLHEQYAPLVKFLRTLDIPAPRELTMPAELVLNARLRDELSAETVDTRQVLGVLDEARAQTVRLDDVTLAFTAEESLERACLRIEQDPRNTEALQQLHDVVELVRILPFDVDRAEVENTYYELLQGTKPLVVEAAGGDQCARNWLAVFDALGALLRVRTG